MTFTFSCSSRSSTRVNRCASAEKANPDIDEMREAEEAANLEFYCSEERSCSVNSKQLN
jgi:hypothetical protein